MYRLLFLMLFALSTCLIGCKEPIHDDDLDDALDPIEERSPISQRL